MRSILCLLALLALSACTAEPAPAPAPAAVASAPAAVACTDPVVEEEWLQHPAGLCGMPDDVRKLVDDYDTCEHFAGEEPYEDARRREIEAAVEQYCAPAPARLAALMQRYRNDAGISEWLRNYAKQADLQPAS
ncbi:hypothetical protein [Xanthomonas campestris]|uniref:hypothetical protein n=1 Tax=Xanthomonas campestris TaxID=339 RepID=UPI00236674BD|nr:hypothetical protein [Xanthomonas campestris]MEA9783123.1 hypothetical protein [Xanthomonas campestris pv. raphani]MEA9792301.1 hypothetical protein [Xanthomonas campestris pv. raphani]MEA9804226.1 hypothetical protein [Xanthomonas campestris pv. raphani]MEA9819163.1 hypothetical protein [Xanthomonas campestris pv. raphani]MEA9871697.1 hypothetical protein [Xanthomonas campestris pv. raphani]